MKRYATLSVMLLLALLVLVGCSGALNAEPGADAGAGEVGLVDDHHELLAALEGAGLDVSDGGTLEDPIFDTTASSILVGDAMIQVFEFADEAAAEAAAATVNATGNIIGLITIDWIEPPHFYRQGKLIALYAGTEEAVLGALEEALGEPFVVGDAMMLPPADE